jgi:hypothetical protein
MVHHFRVLTVDKLREAVKVAQATAQALRKQYARPAAMKRGLTVYYARVQARVQARTKMIVDRITAGMDLAKPIVFALGRNYKCVCLGDRWMPV